MKFPKAKRILALLAVGFVVSTLQAETCKEAYTPGGVFQGCELPRFDKMRRTQWAAVAAGNYNGLLTESFTQYTVDKNGRYTARATPRNLNFPCTDPVAATWSGQLYFVAPGIYAAWNDGSTDGFYMLTVSRNYDSATAFLMGGAHTQHVSEVDRLVRVKRNPHPEILDKLISGVTCK